MPQGGSGGMTGGFVNLDDGMPHSHDEYVRNAMESQKNFTNNASKTFNFEAKMSSEAPKSLNLNLIPSQKYVW